MWVNYNERRDAERYFLLWGGIASLFVHLILALVLTRQDRLPAPPPEILEVFFEPAPKRAPGPAAEIRKQIVSLPKNETPSPPPETPPRFEAEQAASAEKEMIKRGDDLEAGPVVGKKAAPAMEPVPPQPKPFPAKEAKPISTEPLALKLDSGDTQKLLETAPGASSAAQALQTFNTPQPFSRPSGSGAKFLGTYGSSDYIPDLPDGDLTLLNTKANKYAVFVRRVATQVFRNLRAEGWDRLDRRDIQSITSESTVRAVLDSKGALLRAELLESSGSNRFDDVVVRSVRIGARDPHPPPDAARSDGSFSFIFKARSWTRLQGGDSRNAPIRERRWLLLATGLE